MCVCVLQREHSKIDRNEHRNGASSVVVLVVVLLVPVAAEPGAIIGDLKSQASMTNKLHEALFVHLYRCATESPATFKGFCRTKIPNLPSESRTHAMREPIRRVFVQLRAWRPCVPESCNPKASKPFAEALNLERPWIKRLLISDPVAAVANALGCKAVGSILWGLGRVLVVFV